MFRTALGLLLALFMWGSAADAADARMQVLNDSGKHSRPSLAKAMREALPKLLDRIVVSENRQMAETLTFSPALVSSIVPGERTLVEFRADGVFKALDDAGIPYVLRAPRMHVRLELRNSMGNSMAQSEALLAEQLPGLAEHWGIELDADSPMLLIRWQWLDDGRQVMLSVRGNSRLQEFAEIRQLSGGDPVQAVSVWLQEVLVKARDAYVYDHLAGQEAEQPATLESILTIRRQLSLPALVAFESQLASDVRVRSLTPSLLSRDISRYRIQLTDDNDVWLVNWLTQRGWALTPAPGGWDVR